MMLAAAGRGPVVPSYLFAYSGLFALSSVYLAMLLGGGDFSLRSPQLVAKLFVLFPFVQLSSFLFLLYLVARASRFTNSTSSGHAHRSLLNAMLSKTAAPVYLLIGFVVAQLLFDDLFAHVAFSQRSLGETTQESGLVAYLKHHIRDSFDDLLTGNIPSATRMPSGFVLRQWLFFLFAGFAVSQGAFSRKFARATTLVYFLCFVYVSMARMVFHAHLLIDVVVSVMFGTLIFMLVATVLAQLSHQNNILELMDFLLSYALISLPMYLIVSNNPAFWVIVTTILCLLIGCLYLKAARDLKSAEMTAAEGDLGE